MNSIDMYRNYLAHSFVDSKPLDTSKIVDEIFDLYNQNIISEKSFKYFVGVLLTSFIETKFEQKYISKIWDFDDKLASSIIKIGKHYAGK